MDGNHLVSDNNCNIVNLECPYFLTRNYKNVMFTFSVGDTTQIVYD